ncbi:hypothetical protein SDC9_143884 [bioreactor metagenome]|uniref:Uncharacterized protein n=1 Tax=bioreactor metagenome TaxID=1076179 RepID=A0A645E5A5_9ZZZZ
MILYRTKQQTIKAKLNNQQLLEKLRGDLVLCQKLLLIFTEKENQALKMKALLAQKG